MRRPNCAVPGLGVDVLEPIADMVLVPEARVPPKTVREYPYSALVAVVIECAAVSVVVPIPSPVAYLEIADERVPKPISLSDMENDKESGMEAQTLCV